MTAPNRQPPDLGELQQAVEAWTTHRHRSAFIDHWLRPECTLLAYARAAQCRFDGEAGDLLSVLERTNHRQAAQGRFAKASGDDPTHSELQFGAATVEAMLHGLRAAEALQTAAWTGERDVPLPDEFVLRGRQMLAALETAWDISVLWRRTAEPALGDHGHLWGREHQAGTARTAAALRQLLSDESWQPRHEVKVTTWLAARRLLGYVLGDDVAPADATDEPFETRSPVLLVHSMKDEGQVRWISVRSSVEGLFGFYVDPVRLGLTLLDRTLLDSLCLAWHACRSEIQHWFEDRRATPPTLCLMPDLEHVERLEGGSAGGTFACLMLAAAKRVGLNEDATASLRLVVPEQFSAAVDQGDAQRDVDPAEISVAGVALGSIQHKLAAARQENIRHGVLHAPQANWAHAQGLDKLGPRLHGADNLADAYHHLTGDARIERVLEAYSDARVEQWERAWTDPDDRSYRHLRLLYYVPPHYSLLKEAADKRRPELFIGARPDADKEAEAYQRIDGQTEEAVLANLLEQAGDRLCVSEGPGAGKSIFTRRLQAFLSSQAGRDALFDGKPALAVRWEEWGLEETWPEDFQASLADSVRRFCGRDGGASSADDVVRWALENGRVVIILDALDQASDERIERFREFLSKVNRQAWSCRVILTGRPFAVEERRDKNLLGAWRFARIEGFDARQQYRYLYGPEDRHGHVSGEAWSQRNLAGIELKRLDLQRVDEEHLPEDEDERQRAYIASLRGRFPNYEQVADLLGNPAVLYMVRGLAEAGQLQEFRRRGDLYAQTSRYMLHEGAEKVLGRRPDKEVLRLEKILAATAFEMMCQDPRPYRVDGFNRVEAVKHRAGQRVTPPVSDEEWDFVESVSNLTYRTLLYGASDRVLGWPHRGMMEFYCGLHLARNDQADWTLSKTSGDRQDGLAPAMCGEPHVRQAASHEQWHWAFRFAIEMPAELRSDRVLLASLSQLYQPVPRDVTQPNEHLRPTELMYRAWDVVRSLPGGDQVLADYPQSFEGLVEQHHPIALQLLPEAELVRRAIISQADAEVKPQEQRNFALCPPIANPTEADLTFVMGAEGETNQFWGEYQRPRHDVRINEAFSMQATTVTREQYELFDPHHPLRYGEDLKKYAPEPRSPAIYVSWYDAWCFAKWIGAELPTEAQWEFACRAGSNKRYCRIADESSPDGYRDLDSDEDLRVVAFFDQSWDTGPSTVAQRRPNLWGLYDTHGNVWEWCGDWFDSEWYKKRQEQYGNQPAPDEGGPSVGSSRVLRGGSFNYDSVYCRSARRFHFDPVLRNHYYGFRVLRVVIVPSRPS